MTSPRFLVGLLLALLIGAGCRWLGIPAPAPPVLQGALLVVAMTLGYQAADRWLARRDAVHRRDCGGPAGHADPAHAIDHDAAGEQNRVTSHGAMR